MRNKKREIYNIRKADTKILLLSKVISEIGTWKVIAYYPNENNLKHTIVISRVEENLDEYYEEKKPAKRRVFK